MNFSIKNKFKSLKLLHSKKKGMSLIEIMLVMVIVAAIIAGVFKTYQVLNERKDRQNTETLLNLAQQGIEFFKNDVGRYPVSLNELITPPADQNEMRKWGGPYVTTDSDGLVKDSWNNEIIYDKDKKEIYSYGKNGPGSETGWIFGKK
jgi:general secretion pathway protein G